MSAYCDCGMIDCEWCTRLHDNPRVNTAMLVCHENELEDVEQDDEVYPTPELANDDVQLEQYGKHLAKAGRSKRLYARNEDDEEDDGIEGVVDEPDGEPDLALYFSHFDIDFPEQVSICRSYASYLVAVGRGLKARRGPKCDAKFIKKRRVTLAPSVEKESST